MASEPTRDMLDGVAQDVLELYPDVDVIGLPITGRVLRLARFYEMRRGQELGKYGLTMADFDVLSTMRRRARDGSMNVRDLHPSTMLSSGGTTKRLDRLETAGLLERLRDPDDRRGVLIRLTTRGRELMDEVIPAITRFETELVARSLATEQERSRVIDGLRVLLVDQENSESGASDE